MPQHTDGTLVVVPRRQAFFLGPPIFGPPQSQSIRELISFTGCHFSWPSWPQRNILEPGCSPCDSVAYCSPAQPGFAGDPLLWGQSNACGRGLITGKETSYDGRTMGSGSAVDTVLREDAGPRAPNNTARGQPWLSSSPSTTTARTSAVAARLPFSVEHRWGEISQCNWRSRCVPLPLHRTPRGPRLRRRRGSSRWCIRRRRGSTSWPRRMTATGTCGAGTPCPPAHHIIPCQGDTQCSMRTRTVPNHHRLGMRNGSRRQHRRPRRRRRPAPPCVRRVSTTQSLGRRKRLRTTVGRSRSAWCAWSGSRMRCSSRAATRHCARCAWRRMMRRPVDVHSAGRPWARGP